MTDNISDLASWPERPNGQPILKSTSEAFLYAQLVHDCPTKRDALMRHREETYKQLRVERERPHYNLQNMMDLAIRAQLFREAFMETLRIKAEPSQV